MNIKPKTKIVPCHVPGCSNNGTNRLRSNSEKLKETDPCLCDLHLERAQRMERFLGRKWWTIPGFFNAMAVKDLRFLSDEGANSGRRLT